MAEVMLKTGTKIIQSVFSFRGGTDPVLGTFTMAGKEIFTGPAHGWKLVMLIETKTDLFLRQSQFQEWIIYDVATQISRENIMITGVYITILLHHIAK